MIKKFLYAVLFMLIAANSSFAIDKIVVDENSSYLISTKSRVESVSVENPVIAGAQIFYTIYDERNNILLKPRKVGKTTIQLFEGDGCLSFEVYVKSSLKKPFKTVMKAGYSIEQIDKPPIPVVIELDLPPQLEEVSDGCCD